MHPLNLKAKFEIHVSIKLWSQPISDQPIHPSPRHHKSVFKLIQKLFLALTPVYVIIDSKNPNPDIVATKDNPAT